MAFFSASFRSASTFSVCFDVSNDSVLGLADEVQDVVYFFAHGNLFGNLDDGIFEAEVAGVDDSEGVGDVSQDAVGDATVAEHNGVHSVVGCGVSAEDDVGGDVFCDAASALHERVATDAGVCLNDDAVAEDGAFVDFTFSCDAGADSDDALFVDFHVVADVDAIHDEVFISDDGGSVGVGSSGNDDVLSDVVFVADDDVCRLSFFVVEVLRNGADDGVLIDLVPLAEGGSFQDGGMRHDDTVVTDDHVLFHVGERTDFHVFPDFGVGVDEC